MTVPWKLSWNTHGQWQFDISRVFGIKEQIELLAGCGTYFLSHRGAFGCYVTIRGSRIKILLWFLKIRRIFDTFWHYPERHFGRRQRGVVPYIDLSARMTAFSFPLPPRPLNDDDTAMAMTTLPSTKTSSGT